MTEPLPIKRYPNSFPGQVSTTLPTTLMDVPAWDSTLGHLRPSSNVQIDSGNSDKLLFWASVGAFDTVADGATITFNLNLASLYQTTLGGNRALAVSNASLGQVITLLLWQDGTGGRTPVWLANINWDKGLAPIIDPTAGGWNAVTLWCVGADGYGVPIWIELCRSTSAPRLGIKTDTDGATVTFDLRLTPNHQVTLGGNRTLALQTSQMYVGQKFKVKLIQDATGSRTVTWWSGITWAGGVPTLTTTASLYDVFAFEVTAIGGSPTFDGYVLGQGL